MATVQELAAQLANAFEERERVNGAKFYTLAEGSPEWMEDVVRDAHDVRGGMMLPDDWRYGAIRAVAYRIAECEDVEEERADAIGGSLVDVYTSDLTAWLHSRPDRHGYCDDAAEEFGLDPARGIIGLMQLGQYAEYDEIWGSMVGALALLAE
jgi:hypothetical protein